MIPVNVIVLLIVKCIQTVNWRWKYLNSVDTDQPVFPQSDIALYCQGSRWRLPLSQMAQKMKDLRKKFLNCENGWQQHIS